MTTVNKILRLIVLTLVVPLTYKRRKGSENYG